MNSNEQKMTKGKMRKIFFAAITVCGTIWFCHSCTPTPPDAVYAAEAGMTDSVEQIVIKGPVFSEKEEVVKPEVTVEQENTVYHLVTAELTEVLTEGAMTYASTSALYELEWQQEPPKTTVVTLYDEQTKCEYEREIPCLDMREKEVLWEENFSFPITVSGYDADEFWIGDVLISKNEELIVYANHILEMMGLSKEHYRINSIIWKGESYEKEGEILREALAEGEKQVRHVEVTYGGEVKTPDTIGYQYVSIYEIPEKKDRVREETNHFSSVKENEGINLLEQSEGLAEQIHRFLQEHMTVIKISGVFLLFIVGFFLLLQSSRKGAEKGIGETKKAEKHGD